MKHEKSSLFYLLAQWSLKGFIRQYKTNTVPRGNRSARLLIYLLISMQVQFQRGILDSLPFFVCEVISALYVNVIKQKQTFEMLLYINNNAFSVVWCSAAPKWILGGRTQVVNNILISHKKRKIWTYVSTFPVAHDATAAHDVTGCVEARGATAPWGWRWLSLQKLPLTRAGAPHHAALTLRDRVHFRLAAPCRPLAPPCTRVGEWWRLMVTSWESAASATVDC